MPNAYFQFQQFKIDQAKSGMKVTTDACLFGAWVASEISRQDDPNRILDIGTGTGLLSLMLAQRTKHSIIDAVEINELAFEEAQSNFKQSDWKERLNVYQSAIQNFVSDHKYDIIISNPPFFAQSQKGLSESKNQALHASDLLAEELLISIGKFLTENGSFYLLFPEREMDQFIELAETGKAVFKKTGNCQKQRRAKRISENGYIHFSK